MPGTATRVDRLSIRLANAGGTVLGQVDRPLLDDRGRLPENWPVKEQPWFAVLDLPAGLPAGAYTLSAVLYSIEAPNNGVPLTIRPQVQIPRSTPLLAGDAVQRVNVQVGGGAILAFDMEAGKLREGERRLVTLYWQGPATQLQAQIGTGPVSSFQTPLSSGPVRIEVPLIAPAGVSGDQPFRVGASAPSQLLGMVPVAERSRNFANHIPSERLVADFDGVLLDGFDAEWISGPAVDLTIYWKPGRNNLPNRDVQVTLRGSNGWSTTRTGQPDNGGAAIASWHTGETILDGYTIPVPDGAGEMTLEIRVLNPDGSAVPLADGTDRATAVIQGRR